MSYNNWLTDAAGLRVSLVDQVEAAIRRAAGAYIDEGAHATDEMGELCDRAVAAAREILAAAPLLSCISTERGASTPDQELANLSAAATQGRWSGGHYCDGSIRVTIDGERVAICSGLSVEDAAYVKALVNAHRSNRLVERSNAVLSVDTDGAPVTPIRSHAEVEGLVDRLSDAAQNYVWAVVGSAGNRYHARSRHAYAVLDAARAALFSHLSPTPPDLIQAAREAQDKVAVIVAGIKNGRYDCREDGAGNRRPDAPLLFFRIPSNDMVWILRALQSPVRQEEGSRREGWQPIETAPRDGTIIQICASGAGPYAAYYGMARQVCNPGNCDKNYPWVTLDETNGTNCMSEGGPYGARFWQSLSASPRPSSKEGQGDA